MKKVFLTAAVLASMTSVSFAASTNPFTDVPRGHWAYDAVEQLRQDGIIEGYGDGTYRGERTITRYEMAQMIARAMDQFDSKVKSLSANQPRVLDNVNADKAMLDRLAAEFSDELNNLGVRVSNLEKYSDKLKITGELRYVYWSHRDEQDNGSKNRNNINRLELRLFPTAEINDHWSAKARLTTRADLRNDSIGNVMGTYVYAEGKYDNFQLNVGKMPFYSTNDEGLLVDDFFSGAQVTVGNKFKAILEAGRWKGGIFSTDTASYQGIQLNYSASRFTGGIAYRNFESDSVNNLATYRDNNTELEDSARIISAGASYKFGSSVTLAGSYANNTEADNYDNSWSTQLSYKGANKSQPNSWGIYVAYRRLSPNVSFAPTYLALSDHNNRKGVEFGMSWSPWKNIVADAGYFTGETLTTKLDSDTLFGRVRAFF